jgi:nucleotide-binding universal stress UspA family protein
MTALQPIVVGLDFSAGSEAALLRAADLAERLHARLHLVHAASTMRVEHGDALFDDTVHSVERRTREFVEEALGSTEAFDVIGPEVVVRRGEAAADALVRYARQVGAGLVVVGTHGLRGVRRFLMGSVAEEVVRRAPCPVLTVPNAAARTAPGPSAPVLVPVDFSDVNREAVSAAQLIASQFAAPVELVHIVERTGPYPDFYNNIPGLLTFYDTVPDSEGQIEPHLRRFGEDVGGVAGYHVRRGRPDRTIAEVAEETGAGLIVMATHGLTGLDHALIGSVTERTLRRAPCPVLALRAVTETEPA